jgi:hypothetical protein
LTARFDHPVERRRLRGGSAALEGNGTSTVVTFAGGIPSETKADIRGTFAGDFWCYWETVADENYVAGWRLAQPFGLRFKIGGTFEIRRNDDTLFETTQAVGAKQPWHVAWNYNATTGAGFVLLYDYINDTEYVETWEDAGIEGDSPSGDFQLFEHPEVGENGDGQLDELRLWSVQKTRKEFQSLRWRQLTDTESAQVVLRYYAKFDDGSGNTVTDSSPDPMDGTAANHTWRRSLTGGTGDAAGAEVPNHFGEIEHAPLVLVDPLTNTYLAHSGRSEGSFVPREGAAARPVDNSGNAYTDLKTFLAATTSQGKASILTFAGGTYVRFRTAPTLTPTLDFEADALGGVYAATAAEIVRRLITTRGPEPVDDPDELNEDSFDDLDTADESAVHRLSIRPGETIRSAVNRALSGPGAKLYDEGDTGKFALFRFEGVSGMTATKVLSEEHVLDIQPAAAAGPFSNVVIPFRHNPTVLESDQISLRITEGPEGGSPDIDRWKFAKRAYDYAESGLDYELLESYPQAKPFELEESTYVYRKDAIREAERRAALLREEPDAHNVTFAADKTLDLDRFDCIEFSYTDRDETNAEQERIASGSKFLVLGPEKAPSAGQVRTPIYRETFL